MNMKTTMIALAALAMSGTTHAITSEEIESALNSEIGGSGDLLHVNVSEGPQWIVDTNVFHSGTCSFKSGPTGDSQRSSIMTVTVAERVCRMRFMYKVSSESGCDRLEVYDNGSRIINVSGEVAWTMKEVILFPGLPLTCSYIKDGGIAHGSDSVWIDIISIEPIMASTKNKIEVTNIKCQQRYPWNGMVDIDYTVTSDDPNADVWVYPIGYDKDSNTSMAPRALTGDGVNAPVKAGTHRMTWTVTEDYPDFHSTAFTVKMIALVGAAPYMVVDLSGGVDALSYPVSYLSSVPEGGWGDEYKTTKLVLRLIPPGSFMMGSPSDENGRGSNEDLHGVVLTKPFYIGVFEVTQKQYQLVMGTAPVASNWSTLVGDMRPVSYVSYTDIRGSVNGAGWPTHNQVDANSFMGRLRSKVNMLFDLPTDAQWEYACRAGTSTGLNNGKQYDNGNYCSEVARWTSNQSDGKGGYKSYSTKVGCYRENAWGLYDMHGNVWEWCRDGWQGSLGLPGVMDPKGASSSSRVIRGGSFYDNSGIRSACRASYSQTSRPEHLGFRVFCSPVAE